MPNENKTEYKRYGIYMQGQYKKNSKKAQALFMGRAIQQLTEAMKPHEKEKHLRMDTLCFHVSEEPYVTEDGKEVPNWVIITVACDVLSRDPYTEEDRKKDQERLTEARKRREEEEKQFGEAAMKELEMQMNPPRVEGKIQ